MPISFRYASPANPRSVATSFFQPKRATRVAPSSFTVFTVPRMACGWALAMSVKVESAIASISPKPNSGVDCRSAVQFAPKPKERLVGSQMGSEVEKVVRFASSFWQADWLQFGMRDLAAERRGLDAGREDRHLALPLRAEAQDVVRREDVQRTAGGVLSDAHLVDRAARAAEGGLEVTAAARARVEDRPDRRQPLDLGEVDLPVGEQLEVGGRCPADTSAMMASSGAPNPDRLVTSVSSGSCARATPPSASTPMVATATIPLMECLMSPPAPLLKHDHCDGRGCR